MFYESVIAIKNKYGKECKLTKANIKDIYFLTNCNTLNDSDITEFMEKRFSIEEILKWNDEFINSQIDKCYSLMPNRDWETVRKTGSTINSLCRVFTYELKTYVRIIELLQKFYSTYGYFMNYSCLKIIPTYPYDDKTFYPFRGNFISNRRQDRLEKAARSTGAEYTYLCDDEYRGLIPRLYKLKYTDLFNKLLVEIIVPIFEHFYEDSDIMKDNDIKYVKLEKTVEEYSLRIVIKRYFDKYNIPAPEQLKKYL